MREAARHRPALRLLTVVLLTVTLLTSCADPPPPPPPVHDEGDHIFLLLAAIARRPTMPTQTDTSLLIRSMDKIRAGQDACAQWKLDQILAIGMPLVMNAMTADAATQRQAKREARQQLHDASNRLVPAICDGHGFPPISFDPAQS